MGQRYQRTKARLIYLGIDTDGADQLREAICKLLHLINTNGSGHPKMDRNYWNLYFDDLGWIQVYSIWSCFDSFRCLITDFQFQKPPYELSLIKYVEDYFKCSKPQDSDSSTPSCRISDRPPLYFQHSGHSRTIIGIERLKSTKVNLLLFDPPRKPSSVVKDYAAGKVNKKKDLSDATLKPFRVSIDEIAKRKEYQILRYPTCSIC